VDVPPPPPPPHPQSAPTVVFNFRANNNETFVPSYELVQACNQELTCLF
jgi:hypothetical protein